MQFLAELDCAALAAYESDIDLPAGGTLLFFATWDCTAAQVIPLPPGAVRVAEREGGGSSRHQLRRTVMGSASRTGRCRVWQGGHPNFPRPEPPQYYEAAIERLHDLQNWFVTGRSPYVVTYIWPDL